MATYGVSHLTFCFARNLTSRQEALFTEHLVGRHPGVDVDYLNASELTARLTGSEEGRRVARHFFENRELLERIERGQRAGGALAGERDAHERLFAIGEFMAGHDPYFSYPTTVGERSAAGGTGRPEGTIMSVERVVGSLRARTDVIPRAEDAMERYGPRGRLVFSEDEAGRAALEAVQRALHEGSEAYIDSGVSTTWDQMPPMFTDMVGQTMQGRVRIVATRQIAPWTARVTADTDLGSETIDFELAPADAGRDWDLALAGTAGGLTLTVRARWLEAENRGEVRIEWSHVLDPSRAGDQPRALAMLKALHGSGTLIVEDLTGGRPAVRQGLVATEYPQELAHLQAALEAVALLEGRSGVAIGIPEVLTPEDANGLALAAACVRDGGQDIRFESMEFLVPPDSQLLEDDPLVGVTVHHNLDARIFGRVIPLGRTICEMPPLTVLERRPAPDGPEGHLLLKLAPATGEPADIRAVLQPLD